MIKIEENGIKEETENLTCVQSGYKSLQIEHSLRPSLTMKREYHSGDQSGAAPGNDYHADYEKKLMVDFTSSSDDGLSDGENISNLRILNMQYANTEVVKNESSTINAFKNDNTKSKNKEDRIDKVRTMSKKKDVDEKILNYVCEVCGKAFPRRFDIQRHLRIHSSIKPYPCSICGKCFTQRTHMQKHLGTHNSRDNVADKPTSYKCIQCEKVFSGKFYLTRHEKTHTGEREHKCDFCVKEFTQKSHLTKHITNVHGIEDLNGDSFTEIPNRDSHNGMDLKHIVYKRYTNM